MNKKNKLSTTIINILEQPKAAAGFTLKQLIAKAGVKRGLKAEFRKTVDRMQKDGDIHIKDGKISLPVSQNLITADIVKVSGTFGFAHQEGNSEDIFIPGHSLQGAVPGDTVLIKPIRSRGELPSGEVVKIVSASQAPFTGIVKIDHLNCVILPDKLMNSPVQIDRKLLGGAENGDKVLASLVKRGKRHSDHRAAILEVFGNAESAASCCEAILASNGIEKDFPDEVIQEARQIAGLAPDARELKRRLDLRDQDIFTIDSADSKDLDDAIHLRKLDNGWELGVHIADVSYYVKRNSLLDEEAYKRGTSVYFAQSVVPMLPKELSNGICSLNPNEDRLTFSVILRLDQNAGIRSFSFKKTVIRSRVKGIYSEVNALLEGTAPREIVEKYAGLSDSLHQMRQLAEIMMKKRFARGGMNLESTESKIIVDENGKVSDVLKRERGVSERIIEEFMLTANEAAATMALKRELPFVYRVHENPSPEKMDALVQLLTNLGVQAGSIKKGASAKELSQIIEKVKGGGLEAIVNNAVLRSMAKAKYSEIPIGHFGLVLDNYTHFTSPIRRYPDLLIHRILSASAAGVTQEALHKKFDGFVGPASTRSSQRELAAMTAERDCEDCYKAEYMGRFLGESFEGLIVSVAPHGLYVELENTVEGLVRINSLPEGNWVMEENIQFTEAHSGKRLRIGDKVKIIVAGADVSAGHVDFRLSEELSGFPADHASQ